MLASGTYSVLPNLNSSLLSVEAYKSYKNDSLRRPERARHRPSNTALKVVLCSVPERTMAVSDLLCVY